MRSSILERIDQAYALRLLKEMVAINSEVNHETPLAEYLKQELGELGFKATLQHVRDNRYNVLGARTQSEKKPALHFNGHTDTVQVCQGWSFDPFGAEIKDGRLYGLGAVDMKSGIACMLTALKTLIENQGLTSGSLIFSGVVGEEAYSEGAKASLQDPLVKESDAIIIGEPRHFGGLVLGVTGKVLYRLTVLGKSAHGFRPERGINAIDDCARIVVDLPELVKKFVNHPKFGTGNYCTLKIDGGYKVYSVNVPERCVLEVSRLTVPGESRDVCVRDMEQLVSALSLKSQVSVELIEPYYDPYEMSSEQLIVQAMREAYRELTGNEPEIEYAKSIMDSNVYCGEAGIPTVVFGPRGGSAHEANEYVEIESLLPTIKMYVLTATNFMERYQKHNSHPTKNS